MLSASFSSTEILDWLAAGGDSTRGRVVNGEAFSGSVEALRVVAMAPLVRARPGDLCFFFSKEYQSELAGAAPGILVTGDPFVGPLEKSALPIWKASLIISCRDPYLAMARLSALFAGRSVGPSTHREAPVIHPSAVVDASAQVGRGVRIGPHCVVEAGARIGAGTLLHSGCVIAEGVTVGEDCEFFPHVTLYPGTRVGSFVRIHASTVVGSDGFGYAPRRAEGQVVGHEKIHHLGGVRIGNHVEIGANSCVDRGTLGDTVIEDHVKADNLVQIAHNAVAREGAVLCGCSGLAGGSVLGRYAYLGGQACVVNKAVVGDGAMVGAASLITKDVPPGANVAGSPQRPLREHLKVNAYLNRVVRKKGDES